MASPPAARRLLAVFALVLACALAVLAAAVLGGCGDPPPPNPNMHSVDADRCAREGGLPVWSYHGMGDSGVYRRYEGCYLAQCPPAGHRQALESELRGQAEAP